MKLVLRRALYGAAMILCGAACAGAPPAPPPPAPPNPELADLLLSETGTTTIELYLPMDWYFSATDDRAKATLVHGQTKASIEVDHIGASSRILCRWRKLRLRFDESPKKRLYLTTHCNDADSTVGATLQSEAQLYGQALAHRLLDVLDQPAMDTRLVRVKWIDTADPTKILVRPGILVEDAADVARSIAGDEKAFQGPGKEGAITSLDPFDPQQVAEAHLFAMLINNRDWRAFRLKPLGRWFLSEQASPLHNFFAIIPPGARPVLIPQDLDASSFAAIPRPVADVTGGNDDVLLELLTMPEYLHSEPPFVRWLVLRLQSWRRSHAPEVVRGAVARFQEKKAALYAEVDAFAELTPPPMRAALVERSRLHLDAFFRALEPALWNMPVIGAEGAVLYAAATGDATVCTDVPWGTPVILGSSEGGRVAVRFGNKVTIDDGKGQRGICHGPNQIPMTGWVDARAIQAGVHGGAPR